MTNTNLSFALSVELPKAETLWIPPCGVIVKKSNLFAVCILDLEKAFDNVRQSFIITFLQELYIPSGITEYLVYVYFYSQIFLSFKGENSNAIHPTQGVR